MVDVSGLTLFTIASYGTAAAGVVDYFATSAAYNQITSIEDALLSGVDGFFEGLISFGFGVLAGNKGYFRYVDHSLTKELGYLFKKPIETILRYLGFSLPSSIIRKIFDIKD